MAEYGKSIFFLEIRICNLKKCMSLDKFQLMLFALRVLDIT